MDVAAALRSLGLGEPERRSDAAEEARRKADERSARERRTRQARGIWAEAQPIGGTLGERYLRARAIRSPLPPSLRFHPECWHQSACRLPALVATVHRGPDLIAVHRTYVAEPGRKADVDPVKAMLGPVAGGAVRLSSGVGPLVIAEGIETALSLLDGLAGLAPRVWAALSAGGMASLELPAHPGEIVLAPDPDATGQTAAEKLARRAFTAGWRARIMPPPTAGDWNDAAADEVAA